MEHVITDGDCELPHPCSPGRQRKDLSQLRAKPARGATVQDDAEQGTEPGPVGTGAGADGVGTCRDSISKLCLSVGVAEGTRSQLSMVFKAQRLRHLERALMAKHHRRCQTLLQQLGSSVPEVLKAAAKRLGSIADREEPMVKAMPRGPPPKAASVLPQDLGRKMWSAIAVVHAPVGSSHGMAMKPWSSFAAAPRFTDAQAQVLATSTAFTIFAAIALILRKRGRYAVDLWHEG
eukprot:Skav225420  [mRNA]  locus=scaffold680:72242:78301:- [translate_table: standard]